MAVSGGRADLTTANDGYNGDGDEDDFDAVVLARLKALEAAVGRLEAKVDRQAGDGSPAR